MKNKPYYIPQATEKRTKDAGVRVRSRPREKERKKETRKEEERKRKPKQTVQTDRGLLTAFIYTNINDDDVPPRIIQIIS